jgi:2-polyprenyl-3-methyl-5-hydroxy-6-metoxy-1,4-benzoquinol methylase
MEEQSLDESECVRRTCRLCGAGSAVLYAGVTDRLVGSVGLWDYRQCSNRRCRFVWLDPMPSQEQLDRAYGNYYTHGRSNPRSQRRVFRAHIMRTMLRAYTWLIGGTSIARAIREANQYYLGDAAAGRLLEVGCGDGTAMMVMKNRGWMVEGQDVDPNACRVAAQRTGLPVYCGELDCLELPREKYDAVLMVHVIEHVRDPIRMLNVCRGLLKPEGTLVVVTPNVEGLGNRDFGRCWRDMDAPRHLQLFSPKTLSRVAELARFKASSVRTTMAHAHYVGGASIANRRREGPLSDAGRLGLKTALGGAMFQMREAYQMRRDAGCGEECVLMAQRDV